VEGIGTVVRKQRVFFPIEMELAFGDAVAVAADDGAEIGIGLVDIFSNAVVTEDDVCRVIVFVGDDQADDAGAVVGDGGAYCSAVQDIEGGGFVVNRVPEVIGVGEQAGCRGGVCGAVGGGCGGLVVVAAAGEHQRGYAEGKEREFFHIAKL